MKARQTPMFQTEDLPLFSGTAVTAKVSPFRPQPTTHQTSMAKCYICLDTGYFDGGSFCRWCEAGDRAIETRYGKLPASQLRKDGYTHLVKQAPGIVFVYRPAPSYPGKWGQKVVLFHGDDHAGQWYIDEPSILVESLPNEATPL